MMAETKCEMRVRISVEHDLVRRVEHPRISICCENVEEHRLASLHVDTGVLMVFCHRSHHCFRRRLESQQLFDSGVEFCSLEINEASTSIWVSAQRNGGRSEQRSRRVMASEK